MMRLPLQRLHQTFRIEPFDVAKHNRIHGLGRRRIVKMRQVAARNHEDTIPADRARQGIPDPEGRLASRISHHHRHNRHTA